MKRHHCPRHAPTLRRPCLRQDNLH